MSGGDEPTNPGPAWWWFTAWSLQGALVVAASAIGVEGAAAQFALTGLAAALPLAGLFWILRRRGGRPPA